MCKKKILIYPYDTNMEIFLSYHFLSVKFEYAFLVSGYEVKNINEKNENLFVHKLEADMVDDIFIAEGANKLSMEIITETLMPLANKNKRIIISSLAFYKEEIKVFAKENCLTVLLQEDWQKEIGIAKETLAKGTKKYTISTPIISILGVSPNTQKFEMQLYLRNHFQKNGYKVGQIGTRECCEVFGFQSYPSFMDSTVYTEKTKIFLYNNLIKEIEIIEKPDVIILGIPNAIFPLSDKQPFNFGLEAYKILNAVQPDYTIFSTCNGNYNDEFYGGMTELSKVRYNVIPDAFFISDYVAVSHTVEDSFVSFAKVDVMENESDVYSVFNSLNLTDDSLFKAVENKLLQYNQFIQF